MPIQPVNLFQAAGVQESQAGLVSPPITGEGSRYRSIQPNRQAVAVRNMMKFFVPDVGIIEMYVNPQSVTYNDSKVISETRTKGGYTLQYWGPDLTKISINGTTGSSGIEGINVLKDVYDAEQVAFDKYGLLYASEYNMDAQLSSTGPSLASLAFTVELYWSGWIYRGYFKSFRVDEKADKLGLFDYDMQFVATQKRGLRLNFLPYHRSPVHGPSNSDPDFGVPYSYNGLAETTNQVPSTQYSGNNSNSLLAPAIGYRGYV